MSGRDSRDNNRSRACGLRLPVVPVVAEQQAAGAARACLAVGRGLSAVAAVADQYGVAAVSAVTAGARSLAVAAGAAVTAVTEHRGRAAGATDTTRALVGA